MTGKTRFTFNPYYHDIIIDEVSNGYGVDKDKIFLGGRQRRIIDAKRTFLYVLRTMFDLTLQEIAKITNLHHASVIHHTRQFEFFYGLYLKDTSVYDNVEEKILEFEHSLDASIYKSIEERVIAVEVDDMIEGLEKSQEEIEKELIKLYNIKNKKNVRKERKNLLTK